MTTPASRLGDTVIHPGCGAAVICSASPNVFINGIKAARHGDCVTPHCPDMHSGVCIGVRPVYVNGRDLQGIGDPVSCGAYIAGGSPNVFVP